MARGCRHSPQHPPATGKKLLAARGHINFARRSTDGFIKYDCSQCAEQPYLYAKLGHDGPPEDYWRENAVTGEALECCPVMTMLKAPPEKVSELLRMENLYFPLFEEGHLLESGGVADQQVRYLEYMIAIREMRALVQQKYTASQTPTEGHG